MIKLKAIWVSDNPFLPDVNDLSYSKTIEVEEGYDKKVFEDFAIKNSKPGYHFKELVEIKEGK